MDIKGYKGNTRVGMLFSGGPAPSANAVISSAALSFINARIPVYGFHYGFEFLENYDDRNRYSLVEGVHYEILTHEISGIRNRRGVYLKTSRANPGKNIKTREDLNDPDKIRNLIGPGGKTIRKIQEECKVQIDTGDDGHVTIVSPDQAAIEKALLMVRQITEDAEVGQTYTGKVKRIMKFGAFVEILPGVEGMVHISQLDHNRVNQVEDVVNIGDEVTVKVIEVDSQGRVNLSRKALLPEPAGGVRPPEPSREPRGDRPDRGDRGPRRDHGHSEGGR